MTMKEAQAMAWAEGVMGGLRHGRERGGTQRLCDNEFESATLARVMAVLNGLTVGEQPDLDGLFKGGRDGTRAVLRTTGE